MITKIYWEKLQPETSKKAHLFETIFDSCLKKTREFDYQIIGYDKAPSAVAKAKENLKNANLSDYIKVYQKNFFDTEKEDKNDSLHIVFNPPYNERLHIDIQQFYESIGNTLKNGYPNTKCLVYNIKFRSYQICGFTSFTENQTFQRKTRKSFAKLQNVRRKQKTKKRRIKVFFVFCL